MDFQGGCLLLPRMRWISWVCLSIVGFLSSGCSCHLSVPVGKGEFQNRDYVSVSSYPLKVRVFQPQHPDPRKELLVYATGDGGWLGLGGNIFEWLTQLNYPVVGFSSRAYVKALRHSSDSGTTTPSILAQDYAQIIDFAKTRMGLPPETSIILVGLSRGAGLSVVAAGEGRLNGHLAGLLTIALTKEEEYVHHRFLGGFRSGLPIEIQTYEYLKRIQTIPVVVLQSTKDGYLPADHARQLFGPDTDLRKLHSIEAGNHGFSNLFGGLYQETRNALDWMTGRIPDRPATAPDHFLMKVPLRNSR
jgi:pimeloyl-ACP methyl ester carboxylesterase